MVSLLGYTPMPLDTGGPLLYQLSLGSTSHETKPQHWIVNDGTDLLGSAFSKKKLCSNRQEIFAKKD